MKIIEPSVGLWKQGDDVKAHVAKCARVCYGKETGNDDVTINTLLKKHHWSMFRHESVYVIGEFTSRLSIALTRYDNNPYIDWTFHNDKLYIVTNGNFILDLKEQQEVNAHAQVLLTYINYYRVSEDTFFNNEIGYNMMRYTFCIITQISTSRELNRVSPNNIAEQSTRYVYENGNLCRPYWISPAEAELFNNNNSFELDEAVDLYLNECNNSFNTYKFLIEYYNFSRHNDWTPKPTRNIDCVEIEIAHDNWIMAVDTNDIDLIYLSLDYYIQWENCFCMKDIRLEDVTPELEKKAFEEIENNK